MGNLGMPEILMILVIALIIFGPRKLPELGKTLGNSLAQFRKASEDFKRQWEEEVEVEKRKIDASPTAEATRQAEIAAQDFTASASAEPAVSAATGDHYVTTSNDIYAPVPTIEPAPSTVPRSETAVKETKRDWM